MCCGKPDHRPRSSRQGKNSDGPRADEEHDSRFCVLNSQHKVRTSRIQISVSVPAKAEPPWTLLRAVRPLTRDIYPSCFGSSFFPFKIRSLADESPQISYLRTTAELWRRNPCQINRVNALYLMWIRPGSVGVNFLELRGMYILCWTPLQASSSGSQTNGLELPSGTGEENLAGRSSKRGMAERVGFEPTCPCGQDAFEAPPLRPLRYLSEPIG